MTQAPAALDNSALRQRSSHPYGMHTVGKFGLTELALARLVVDPRGFLHSVGLGPKVRAQLRHSQVVLGVCLLDVPGSAATAEAADSSSV